MVDGGALRAQKFIFFVASNERKRSDLTVVRGRDGSVMEMAVIADFYPAKWDGRCGLPSRSASHHPWYFVSRFRAAFQ